MTAAADTIVREVTSWEGVTVRHDRFGGVELRLGRYVLGLLPQAGPGDEQTVVARLREAYERAAAALDRRAGVLA
jgi:hypothetical protein